MRRWLAVALLVVMYASPARALEVTAEVDRDRVAVGDHISLTVTVSGSSRSLPEPRLPDLSGDFDVTPQGTSRNFSFVNGRLSSSLAQSYLLVPRREGRLVIGAARATDDKGTATSEPIAIEVTAAAPAPVPDPATPGETGTTSGNEDIFVRATVDNPSPYVNQQVTYRVRLYSRVNLLDNPGFTPPTTEGFWKEDLPHREPYTEMVEGRRYQVLEVGLAVFPTTVGRLVIGEAVLECTVGTMVRNRNSVFGGSFFDGKRVVLRTEPLELEVRPLPPPPAGFSGAVGEFTLNATPDKREVSPNDPLTLTLTVRGRGNLRVLGDLAPPRAPGFRVYPSPGELRSNIQNGRWGGTLKRDFVLVPLTAGEHALPPVELVVFDPSRGGYRTLSTPAISVRASSGAPGAEPLSGGARGGIEVVGSDVRFIETQTPQWTDPNRETRTARAWMLALPVPALLYGVAWWVVRRRQQDPGDAAERRRRRAARNALGMLNAVNGDSGDEAAAGAARALRTYLADRFALPRAGLTLDRLEPELAAEGVNPAPLREFLDRADAARYAPQPTRDGAAWAEEARQLIAACEGEGE